MCCPGGVSARTFQAPPRQHMVGWQNSYSSSDLRKLYYKLIDASQDTQNLSFSVENTVIRGGTDVAIVLARTSPDGAFSQLRVLFELKCIVQPKHRNQAIGEIVAATHISRHLVIVVLKDLKDYFELFKLKDPERGTKPLQCLVAGGATAYLATMSWLKMASALNNFDLNGQQLTEQYSRITTELLGSKAIKRKAPTN